ncbi:hypothetical protein Tdes44962_MAKER00580 [Teratosphaeria destructans]|uniref:Uncharacterized protein n=1 Tax=Teratosphaeria destructans TaxID=418781 RepID=A0A9W7SN41_9PEZI|nr:hypothetical protein Tdes44962_MAKER00580 [Teratosphaeria destructans]
MAKKKHGQRLCADVEVEVGSSITQCKKALRSKHINLIDFVRMKKRGGDVSECEFPTRKALRNYILFVPGKVFRTLKKAKENGFISQLLIQVWNAG